MQFDESKHPRQKGKFVKKTGARDSPMQKLDMYGQTVQPSIKANNGLVEKTVKVDLISDVQRQMDKASTHKERQKIAFEYIKNNLRGQYTAKDGRVIDITKKTANKYTHNATDIKLKVAPELGNLIEHSQFVKLVDADIGKNKFDKFAYYEVNFDIGNDNYVGLLNVGVTNNGMAILYDLRPYEQIKKE